MTTLAKILITSLVLLSLIFAILLAHKDKQLKQAQWLAVKQNQELVALNHHLASTNENLSEYIYLHRLVTDLGK